MPFDTGFELDEGLIPQLEAFGAPDEIVEHARRRKSDVDFEVFPDNWQTVAVFLNLSSQWRIIAGMGGATYQGIEFASIEPCLRLMGVKVKKWPAIFRSLVVMAGEAAAVINERNKPK